jgi:hypothetical protein
MQYRHLVTIPVMSGRYSVCARRASNGAVAIAGKGA